MNGPHFANFDPYATLGVSAEAEFEVLKAAYRRLVRENHPDMASDKSAATARMTQINAAWHLVGDPAKRAAFDARQRLEAREKAAQMAHKVAQTVANSKTKAASAKSHSHKHPGAKTGAKTSVSGAKPKRANAAPAKKPGAHRLEEASRLLFGQSKPSEAIELCRSVIRSDFRNVLARELMGEAFLRLNQPERASAIWEQALILQPDNPGLHRRWRTLRENLAPGNSPFNAHSGAAPTSGSAAPNPGSKPTFSPDKIPTIHAVVRPMPVERPSLWKRLGASLRRK